MLMQHVAKLKELTFDGQIIADINKDVAADIKDEVALLQYVAKLTDKI